MKRRRTAQIKFIDGVPLDPTSSLNDYYMCVCGRKYTQKHNIIRHLRKCNGLNTRVVCHWCNLEFKNRGNLATHAHFMHGDKKSTQASGDKDKTKHKCNACEESFSEARKLRYHIRRYHFNLWARIPHAEAKRVNQVWFEKVLNTNLVVQIQKTALNTLVMKPLPPTAGIEIDDNNRRLDLRGQYPLGPSKDDEVCRICFKIYRKVDLQKHMNETHFKVMKHKCNNCNQSFKRSYIYLQHVCHKVRRRRRKVNGVKHVANSSIKITSVESLKAVVID